MLLQQELQQDEELQPAEKQELKNETSKMSDPLDPSLESRRGFGRAWKLCARQVFDESSQKAGEVVSRCFSEGCEAARGVGLQR